MNLKDGLTIAVVIGVWGVNFLFMRWTLDEVPPMVLGMLRFACVVFPALLLVRRPPVRWYWLALYGLSISFGQFGLMFTALAWGLPTGLAALVLQVQVFFTVLLAGLLWREPLLAHHVWGMGTAAAGLVLIGIGQHQGPLPLVSLLPVLGAAACWACGNLLVKRIGPVPALSLVVWGSLSALAAFTAASLLLYGIDGLAGHLSRLSVRGMASIVFLAYVASLVGYVLLDERLGVWHWLGMAVVMAGLLLHVFGKRLRFG